MPRNIKDRLTAADLERFKDLYLEGKLTNPQIGEAVGISQFSVKRWAKKLLLPNKYSLDHPNYKKRYFRAGYLYKTGLSTKQVGSILGLNDETVRRYIIEQGIEMRESNGMPKAKFEAQNKLIRELWYKGTYLKEIGRIVGVGKHGLERRLATMGLRCNQRVKLKVVT